MTLRDDVGAYHELKFFGFTLAWPLLLFAVLPVRWLFLHRRERRRLRLDLCPVCGYDLRATPEAGGPLLERCPECGMVREGETTGAEAKQHLQA